MFERFFGVTGKDRFFGVTGMELFFGVTGRDRFFGVNCWYVQIKLCIIVVGLEERYILIKMQQFIFLDDIAGIDITFLNKICDLHVPNLHYPALMHVLELSDRANVFARSVPHG